MKIFSIKSICPVLTALILVGCNSSAFSSLTGTKKSDTTDISDDSNSEIASDDSIEEADIPIWINGVSLTCNWESIESETEVGIQCGYTGQSQEFKNEKPNIETKWSIETEGIESEFSSAIDPETTNKTEIILIITGSDIPISTAKGTIKNSDYSKNFELSFQENLPGLKEGSGLSECLRAERPVTECFTEAKITVKPLKSESATSLICPSNYVPVPPNADVGTTSEFCVAKYEMRLGPEGTAISDKSGLPWGSISQLDAIATCKQLGVGYGLIKNEEWMTIARDIEAQGSNWKDGIVDNSSINSGHSDKSPFLVLAGSIDANPCFGTEQVCDQTTWDGQRRTHNLSNGERVWDFSGNLYEWIDWFVMTDKAGPSGNYGIVLPTATMPLSTYMPTNTTLTSRDSIGTFRPGTEGVGGAASRGGVYSTEASTGIYALRLSRGPTEAPDNHGFRCVYRGIPQ